MSETKIEWATHTINFWWGCTKVSPGCAHCYAEGLDARFHGGEHWGKGAPRKPRLEAARKEAMALNRRAAKLGVRYRVFGNSMNDWLDPEVPIDWLGYMLETVINTPHLDWMLLTKRPELWRPRMGEMLVHYMEISEMEDELHEMHKLAAFWNSSLNWNPHNVWVGTSAEDQDRLDERILYLLNIPAKVRFLSCEPLLGDIRFLDLTGISWVIVGGESGPNARPMHPEWARSLRDQCQEAGVAFFFKQWGEYQPGTVELNPDPKNYRNHVLSAADGKQMGYYLGRKNDHYNHTSGKWNTDEVSDGDVISYWKGKDIAGRLLDGREWNEFPREAKS